MKQKFSHAKVSAKKKNETKTKKKKNTVHLETMLVHKTSENSSNYQEIEINFPVSLLSKSDVVNFQ